MPRPIEDRKNYPHHIKINAVGYILGKAREQASYAKEEVPFAVARSASGDPNYRDTKFWQHWVQEDWTEGIHQILWESASRFYESLNVDTTEEFEMVLAPKVSTIAQPTSAILAYHMAAARRLVIGAENSSKVDSLQDDGATWRNEGTIADSDYCYCVKLAHGATSAHRLVWIGTGDKAAAAAQARIYKVDTEVAANLTEVANLDTLLAGTVNYTLDVEHYGGKMWVLAGGHSYLAWSDDDGATWTALGGKTLLNQGYKVDGEGALAKYAGYLIAGGGSEGHGFLLATDGVNLPVEIANFKYTGIHDLEEWGGYLWIATTGAEIWFFNGATTQPFFTFPPSWGVTIKDLHAAEGELWVVVTATDATKEGIYIINKQGIRHYLRCGAGTDIYCIGFFGEVDTTYIGTADAANTIYKVDFTKYQDSGEVHSSFHDAQLPSIPKLYHKVTIQTDPLPASTSVQVFWRAKISDSWTSLGTFSTTNGTEESFSFAAGTIEKQIHTKTTLAQTAGADDVTPTVKKVIVQYDLSPYLVNVWNLRLVCADNIRLLDQSREAKNGQELMENLYTARRAAKVVTFQDLDYAENQLNGQLTAANATVTVDSTKGFPNNGRIRIEDEEIYYTGKTATTFTGCTRGGGGTTAAIHADNTQVDNGYDVLVYRPRQVVNTLETLEGELEVSLLQA